MSEDGILSVTASNEIGGSIRAINKNKFYHSFQLPEDADMDEIEAIYKNNTLTISIGKTITEVLMRKALIKVDTINSKIID